MNERSISPTTYLLVWLALLFLLFATVVAAWFDSGLIGLLIGLIIAACKAVLIVVFFMHVRVSSRLTRVFAAAGFFWLAIMLALTMADYLSRGWLPGPLK